MRISVVFSWITYLENHHKSESWTNTQEFQVCLRSEVKSAVVSYHLYLEQQITNLECKTEQTNRISIDRALTDSAITLISDAMVELVKPESLKFVAFVPCFAQRISAIHHSCQWRFPLQHSQMAEQQTMTIGATGSRGQLTSNRLSTYRESHDEEGGFFIFKDKLKTVNV